MSATIELAGQHPNVFDRARNPAASEPDALAPLAAQSALIRAGRDEQIFGQDDPAKYCYFVLSGCVRSVFLIEDGRRQVSEFLLPGDLFGWEAADKYRFQRRGSDPRNSTPISAQQLGISCQL